MITQNIADINRVVVHCSATIENKWINASDIDKWHKERGFAMIGYHNVIRLDGSVERGRPYNVRGAHVHGHNKNTIGICLIGGLDYNLNPKNTFTNAQLSSLYAVLIKIRDLCPLLMDICGHRDLFPDLNNDGIIDNQDWLKDCPCFDVRKWIKNNGFDLPTT